MRCCHRSSGPWLAVTPSNVHDFSIRSSPVPIQLDESILRWIMNGRCFISCPKLRGLPCLVEVLAPLFHTFKAKKKKKKMLVEWHACIIMVPLKEWKPLEIIMYLFCWGYIVLYGKISTFSSTTNVIIIINKCMPFFFFSYVM